VARAAFAEPGAPPSMAEIARRAGVGMATLYRNFPGRRELLEALYTDEVDAICAAAETLPFTAWVHRFLAFSAGKRGLAAELLALDRSHPMVNASRDRVLAAGRPLLAAAQRSGELRPDLTLEQVLDMVMAIARIEGDAGYVEPILAAALDGLRNPVQPGG
jgi:AcrR family transcriptional regulator